MKLLSERLKWVMSERSKLDGREIIPADIAKAAKVTDAAVSNWLNDGNGMSAARARLVGAYLRVNPIWLETGSGEPNIDIINAKTQEHVPAASLKSEVDDGPDFGSATKQLPVVGQVQAGPDGLLHIDDYPVGHGAGTVPYWTRCPEAYALRIRGESMSPRYLPGEFVAVDPCTDVLPNNEVIAILKDGRRMIKRLLWQNDEQICFESINKNYQNIICERVEIERLHKVLGGIPAEAFKKNF